MLKKIIFPRCAADEEADALNDFMSTFGVSQENATETESTDTTEEATNSSETEAEAEAETQIETATESEKNVEDNTAPPQQNTKSANAFAQMRIENKKYQNMIQGIAGVLGVNAKDPDEVFKVLQDKVIDAQAKQQGMSPDVARRLAMLEEQNAEYAKQEARKAAYLGFQKVKDSFGLDDNALNSFADELVASGVNPFEQPVDVVSEYKLRNFDKLLKAAEERGARAEAERAAKASSKSSSPDPRRGSDESTSEKINNVADLNRWFEKNK